MEERFGMSSKTLSSRISTNTRSLLFFMACTVLSVLIPLGAGFGIDAEQILTVFLALLIASQIPYMPVILLLSSLPIFLYLPTGVIYGKPHAGILASFFETNALEALEFLGILPIQSILFSLTLLTALIIWFTTRPDLRWWKGKFRVPLTFLCIALFVHSATFKFYKYNYNGYLKYSESTAFLMSASEALPDWEISEMNGDKYQIQVVVIGESVRKDYLSAYGYPHPTTPFLDSVSGYFLDGYVSAAPNTSTSLPRTLSISAEDQLTFDPAHNAVTLANAAGLETWWISNQGTLGVHDVGVAAIAARSQNRVFLKRGEYDAENKDDYLLLEKLEAALEGAEKNRKLIFLHMMGSHANECKRLHGYPVNFSTPHGERFNCYLATLEKTDNFLRVALDMLKRSGQTYSMVYFSDHGMLTRRDTGSSEYQFRHGSTYQQNYEIPFFILASDINERIVQRKNLSAYRFMDFFANWIGVTTPLTHEGYDIRTAPHDSDVQVYNFSKLVRYDGLESQAALH